MSEPRGCDVSEAGPVRSGPESGFIPEGEEALNFETAVNLKTLLF
jgi:hypothetical protein